MGLTDTVFGTPPKTTLVQTPGTKDPGFGFAKDFFNFLPSLMNQAYPSFQGQIDPGMSPTMADMMRRAQGYAQSGPSEILQGAQGSLGRFMSPSFQNPWNTMFGGAPNYGGVDSSQRIFGGGQAGSTAFQNGMPGMPGMQPEGGDPRAAMMAKNMSTGQTGGMVNGQWQPNPGQGGGQPGSAPGGMPSAFPNALEQAMNRQASPFGGGMASTGGQPTSTSVMDYWSPERMAGAGPQNPSMGAGSDAMLAALQGDGGFARKGSSGPPTDTSGMRPMPLGPEQMYQSRMGLGPWAAWGPEGGGQPQLPPMSPTMGGAPGGPGGPGIPGGPISPPGFPPPAQWGSGQNAQRGFLDFMSGIGKDFRQKSPMDYVKDLQTNSPNVTHGAPQGSAATDWRSYWKSLGRPGAPGAGPGGGGPGRPGGPGSRGPTDRPIARPIPRPGQPTDMGVAKPMPKKMPPPVEILRAFG